MTNNILAIESSSETASVAIMNNDRILAEKEYKSQYGHASWLIILVQDLLQEACVNFSDLSQIIVGVGPGSFTGIRVGIAAAKGLGLSLGIDVKGISSLGGVAASHAKGKSVISLISSRRNTYFIQAFDMNLMPVSGIIDGETTEIAQLVVQGEEIDICGYNADGITSYLKERGIQAVTGTSHSSQALGLITYSLHHPHLEEKLEPLYLAPPILGPKKQKPAS